MFYCLIYHLFPGVSSAPKIQMDKRKVTVFPDARPGNISFRLSMSGGMLYYYEDLYISADSCYYLVNDGGAISKIYFTMARKGWINFMTHSQIIILTGLKHMMNRFMIVAAKP